MKDIDTNIRKNIISERQKLDVVSQEKATQEITKKLIALDIFKQSKKIAVYYPIRGEVSTIPIIETIWAENKYCYLPTIKTGEKTLSFAQYSKNDLLIPGEYKIPEPQLLQKFIAPQDLDLVIAPIVGFDSACNRLGYGAGFYDQTFAFRKSEPSPFLIGIAYELQKKSFALNTWDIPLDIVITEKMSYKKNLKFEF